MPVEYGQELWRIDDDVAVQETRQLDPLCRTVTNRFLDHERLAAVELAVREFGSEHEDHFVMQLPLPGEEVLDDTELPHVGEFGTNLLEEFPANGIAGALTWLDAATERAAVPGAGIWIDRE